MARSTRREFLRTVATGSSTATAALVAAGLFPRRIFAQESSGFNRIVYRQLGSTGFKVSEVGFGCMNMREPELVYAAIDQGINYIDTANRYMNGANEEVVGEVMKTKRDKVFLTTKVGLSKNIDDMQNEIEASIKRLQTDHVDLLLLHSVSSREEILNEKVIKIFDNAIKRGMTRFVGISSHDQVMGLDTAVESKFWEAVLVPYNYFSPPEVTASIKKAREAGLAIIAMKNFITTERPRQPFPDIRKDKSGKTTNQQALLKWVLENPYVDTTIPGITSFEQLSDDIAVMGMKLTLGERSNLKRFSESTKGYYCHGIAGCSECQGTCPEGVDIREINRCINYAYGYGSIELARENYRALPHSNHVDVCADCDECVVKCVNGLNLTENIRRAKELFA